MGLLNSLKDAANKALNVADQKLGKAVETASSILISEPESKLPEKDLNDILYDLVYKKKRYEKAIEICNKHLHSNDAWEKAVAYNYRAICYLNNANAIPTDFSEFSDEERSRDDFDGRLKENREERNELLTAALSDIDVSLKICEDNNLAWYDFSALDKGDILWNMAELDEARRWFILAMGSSIDEIRSDAKANYEEITKKILNIRNNYQSLAQEQNEMREFCEADGDSEEEIQETLKLVEETILSRKFENLYPFGERQFIFVVKNTDKIAGCYDSEGIINWVFTLNQIPGSVIFPVGHPQANTLYIAHPAQKGVYLPYEGAEEKIFHEKIEEFCRLAQCLGATEISFQSLKGESISESFSERLGYEINMGVTGEAMGVGFGGTSAGNRSGEHHKKVGYSYSLQPKTAYIPSDVPWLEIDKSWQVFVKQRMESNLLSYTKRISSSEAINLSNSLSTSVKSSFENLMLNVNGNFSIETDSTFSRSTNSEWEIQIQFASLDELELIERHEESDLQSAKQIEQQSSASLSEAEEKYKEEVLFILEDGEITDTERRFLERKRIKLGLSEEQAAYVESLCVSGLRDEEKEYFELYREIVGEGGMTDRKRKMLDREAISLGISLERARELENMS